MSSATNIKRERIIKETEDAYPLELWDLAMGYRKSQALFMSCSLGIFDALAGRPGGATCHHVASACSIDHQVAGRMLDICVGLGLVLKSSGSEEAMYVLEPQKAPYLTSSHEKSMVSAIKYESIIYHGMDKPARTTNTGLWSHSKSYRCFPKPTNPSPAESENGPAGGSLTRKEQPNGSVEEECKQLRRMSNCWKNQVAAQALVNAFDLSKYHNMCDIAGGIGAMAVALTRTYPQAEVCVLEHPDVLSEMEAAFRAHFSPQDRTRISYKPLDFSRDDFPSADLMLTSHVMCLISDEEMDNYVRKVFQSLLPGGAYLLCERLLNDTRTGPVLTQMNEFLCIQTQVGKERPYQQYKDILSKHGFHNISVKKFSSHIGYDAILARKPETPK